VLKVYNLLGQEVATLVDEFQKAGYKSVEWNAVNISAGVYLIKINTQNYSDVRKIILIK